MPLTDTHIMKRVSELRKKNPQYAPLKYFKGLSSLKEVEARYNKMLKKDYKVFKTDKDVKTKTSSYTKRFRKRYPDAKSLEEISLVTGIPLKTIKTIYDRGLAAWRTGHRPGATPQQWGYARVHSFVVKGRTYYTADKDLVSE